MAAKKLSFEEKLSRLEEIVAALEKGDAPLADSLRLFEEGTKLVNACSTELDKAEQQVVKLMKGPDGAPVELPFESTEDWHGKDCVWRPVSGISGGHRGIFEQLVCGKATLGGPL